MIDMIDDITRARTRPRLWLNVCMVGVRARATIVIIAVVVDFRSNSNEGFEAIYNDYNESFYVIITLNDK